MIVGIDVGLTGACAVLTDDGEAIEVCDMPVMASGQRGARVRRQVDAGTLSRMLRRATGGVMAFVEAQSARPGQGVAGVFSLGQSYGTVTAVLAAVGIPFLLVQPRAWKAYHGLVKAEKAESLARARRLFPEVDLHLQKHHNRAEALLLALYGVEQAHRRVA